MVAQERRCEISAMPDATEGSLPYALGMTMFPIFTGNIATASSMANAYFALVGIAVAAGIVAVAGMRKMSS